MVKEIPLLDCPFCGSKAQPRLGQAMRGRIYYQISCIRCSGNTKKDTKFEAIEQWNRRLKVDSVID